MAFLSDFLLSAEVKTWLTVVLPTIFITYWISWVFYARNFHPLAQIPGPFWPSVTRVWIVYHAHAGDLEIQQRALHERYGPLVRVAPDEVVCADPREIPTIYPLSKPLEKTPWYDVWRPVGLPGRRDMFTNRSEKDHAAYQRMVAHIYSLSNVLKSEPELDKTCSLFIERLGEFADSNEAFDFGLWLEMYCYDNIGVIFFGKQFGFLKDRIDYKNYIKSVHQAMPLLHALASAPAYARPFLIGGAVCVPKLLKAVFAVDNVRRTAQRETYGAQERAEADTEKRVDMTSAMLRIMRDKGNKHNFGLNEIASENFIAVMAGADSTSISLRSVFYFMMKNAKTLEKARAEVDAAFANGTLTSPVQQSQAVKLTYVSAVIRESFRLFSPFSVSQSRYSPSQGVVIAGTYIPSGWRIGCNPAVVQHHKQVFGEDAESFRPARWIDSSAEQIKLMNRCMQHFGAGTRRCTGQNVSRLLRRALRCANKYRLP
ncbi:cytochrome P450 [Clathrospora elynae]|uniref:Cytochrome P450 n=1 Tax=Clathrospora elynae TaxID=706981 RepID=A0A6A5SQ91_9PLEO|nr:cytochrome P450 [Clathrospora elynae]